MIDREFLSDQIAALRDCVRSLSVVVPLGVIVGSACALFLWSLDTVTAARFSFPGSSHSCRWRES